MAERLITFNQAERVNAYELARKWGAHEWPARLPANLAGARGVAVRGVADDLEELAVMAALRKWLDAWTPGQIHSALLAGASVEQVAVASGLDPLEVSAAWREWSAGQRHLWETFPDMDRAAEHDRVAAILDAQPDTTIDPIHLDVDGWVACDPFGRANLNPAPAQRTRDRRQATCPRCLAAVAPFPSLGDLPTEGGTVVQEATS